MYLNKEKQAVCEKGSLQREIKRNKRRLHVVSIVVKYVYSDIPSGGYELDEVALACIPNGMLQEKYNPNPESTIWRAGRHAPTLGEEFRVRLVFDKLHDKEPWRVRKLSLKEKHGDI